MNRLQVPNVLAIAGSDPSGGAGVQGDLKTFAAHRVHGCAVITALTAQSTRGVEGVLGVDPAFVGRQLRTLLDDVEIRAIKVGMLGSAPVVHAVAAVLLRWPHVPVVLDPVLHASSGGALLDEEGFEVLVGELLPLATLVTPNAVEAGALLAADVPTSMESAELAARAILRLGARAVVVTGGHVHEGAACRDVLATGEEVHVFTTPRVAGAGAHGTGCAYSSSVAALLALGHTLPSACLLAQRFVAESVRASAELAVGHGTPPVHVLGRCWH